MRRTSDALALHALTRQAIERAEASLAAGDLDGYLRQTRSAIITGHVASAWSAVASRDHAGRARAWLAGRLGGESWEGQLLALPPADRTAVRERLKRELAFFDRFAAEARAGNLSPDQIRARGRMYAGAVRPTYYALRWGAWDIPARLLPGNQICTSNCRCTIEVIDHRDGTGTLIRTLGATERHCPECPPLAGRHRVYRKLETPNAPRRAS